MIFKSFNINKIRLKNKIFISPMCQYSAKDGSPTIWHYKHLQNLSSTGAALVMLESTAISKEGRISPFDLCLYNNLHEKNLRNLIKDLKSKNDTKYGIQISHSGRKGSSQIPWIKSNCALSKKNSWKTVAPSMIPRDKGWPNPEYLTKDRIKKLISKFISSAKRANKIGFDCLEIHMAHGYLLHQFFSPISNRRNDEYGGSYSNRSRLLIEIGKKIRKIWPKNKILGARITATDHLNKGIQIEDAIKLSKDLKKIGIDYISISSGGIIPKTKMKQFEGFRINMAERIKKNSNILVTTSGKITRFSTFKNIINKNRLHFFTIARPVVKNPQSIFELAKKFKKNDLIPNQYKRII